MKAASTSSSVLFQPLRRRLSLLGAGLLVSAASAAQAAGYPEKPITLVLGYSPGGSVDAVARAVAPDMSKALGQSVVVDYKPGASGMIAARAVADARPDGYTIHLVESATLTILPSLRDVGYSPKTSFTPIGTVAEAGMLLATNVQVPAKTLPELITWVQASPGKHGYATSGMGSVGHVGMELLQIEKDLQTFHVAYKGGAPAMTDLIGGQVPMIVTSLAPALPQLKAKAIQPIGLMAPKRSSALPDVPTIAEQGVPGFEAMAWYALVGPAGMPPEIVGKLQAALNTALASQQVVTTLRDQGLDVAPQDSAGLAARIDNDVKKWDVVIKKADIKLE